MISDKEVISILWLDSETSSFYLLSTRTKMEKTFPCAILQSPLLWMAEHNRSPNREGWNEEWLHTVIHCATLCTIFTLANTTITIECLNSSRGCGENATSASFCCNYPNPPDGPPEGATDGQQRCNGTTFVPPPEECQNQTLSIDCSENSHESEKSLFGTL